jgi:hypothetical protein
MEANPKKPSINEIKRRTSFKRGKKKLRPRRKRTKVIRDRTESSLTFGIIVAADHVRRAGGP